MDDMVDDAMTGESFFFSFLSRYWISTDEVRIDRLA